MYFIYFQHIMTTVTAQDLKANEQLKDVPVEQLEWLANNSKHYTVEEGAYLFQPGEAIKETHFIISGKFKLYLIQNGSIREFDALEAQMITGNLPFSRGKSTSGYAQATEPSQVMSFPSEKMNELITGHFELTQALVHVMTSRVRDFTTLQHQNEKMMALGKLSAGLSHELNNPAAAIVRGSTTLKSHLKLQPDTFKKVLSINMKPEDIDFITDKLFEILQREDRPVLSLMERTDKEDELSECFDECGIDNGYELAENFVEFGFTEQDMHDLEKFVPAESLSAVLNWINNNLVTEKMVMDIQEASQRISDLVNSVKNFTHMDRAGDMQYSDVHSGLRNTLTMLNYKIKKSSVEIVENFDTTLPQVKAMVGELNQVWTNIIDNALDAMEDSKNNRLEIKTVRDKEFVKVSIIDNGPGIPPEMLSRIFDPFFTTKEMGKGTGLGLDVVSRIVKQHRGSVKVVSAPGHTEFIVCFPFNG